MMKGNFGKLSLAAALTLTGIAITSPQKTVAAATLKKPLKRVQVSYSTGKGLKVWTNYDGGQLISFRAKNGSKWNVAGIAVDHLGRLWYKIGYSEWIEARYTIDLEEKTTGNPITGQAASSTDSKPKRSKQKSAKSKQTQQATTKPKRSKPKPAKSKQTQQATTKPKRSKPKSAKSKQTQQATTKPKPAKSKQATTKPKRSKAAQHTVTIQTANTGDKARGPKYVANIHPDSTTNTIKRAQAVVKLAKKEVGKGYAWGGNGPDNFDCSGLVKYIYDQAGGIKLPRVTTDQVKVGTTIQMDDLQPGDLLFWGSAKAPYYVGIYVGNNQYVCAATPKLGVVLRTVSSYFYPRIAKRVIQ